MKIIKCSILVDCEIHYMCNTTRKIKRVYNSHCIHDAIKLHNFKREKLTNALRVFMRKLEKKVINVLTTSSIFHKSDIKTFF